MVKFIFLILLPLLGASGASEDWNLVDGSTESKLHATESKVNDLERTFHKVTQDLSIELSSANKQLAEQKKLFEQFKTSSRDKENFLQHTVKSLKDDITQLRADLGGLIGTVKEQQRLLNEASSGVVKMKREVHEANEKRKSEMEGLVGVAAFMNLKREVEAIDGVQKQNFQLRTYIDTKMQDFLDDQRREFQSRKSHEDELLVAAKSRLLATFRQEVEDLKLINSGEPI